MRAWLLAIVTLFGIWMPSFVHAQSEPARKNHVEVGVFADYYRFEPVHTTSTVNFLGLGGRAAFYTSEHTAIEAEMAYDFKRNYSTFNSVNTTLSTTRLRPLHALFGPKFDLGTHGADFFLTGKVGFVNFGSTTANAQQGFQNAFGGINNGNTKFALYPGGGIEGFWGPFGLRLDVGDELYFAGGVQNNLRITFGPHFKF